MPKKKNEEKTVGFDGTKQQSIDAMIERLDKAFGEGTLMRLGDRKIQLTRLSRFCFAVRSVPLPGSPWASSPAFPPPVFLFFRMLSLTEDADNPLTSGQFLRRSVCVS